MPDKPAHCRVCGSPLGVKRGQHIVTVKDVPVFSCPVEIRFWRLKGHCEKCGKARSERVDFISEVTPHLTKHYAWWLARLSEIAPISQAARFTEEAPQTLWRLDFARMKKMLQSYKIPAVRHISVDEVYARRRTEEGENRDDLFFTVITDLDRKRVIWVADSRRQEALEGFFEKIGYESCRRIEVVAIDQYEGYAKAVKRWCPRSRIVWDKFHVLKSFTEAANETRKALYARLPKNKKRALFDGKHRFIFLKKDNRRPAKERLHIQEALEDNTEFTMLELIKERMLTVFEAPNVDEAREIFDEVGAWMEEAGFTHLHGWHQRLKAGWDNIREYFTFRTTTAFSAACQQRDQVAQAALVRISEY